MILDHIGLKDMFAFDGGVSLDLRTIGPGVVAITGENGVGKTGLIEIVPGINYGKLPGRENDPPIDYSTSRASFMEYTFRTDAGERYRALLSMDMDQRATDAVMQRVHPDGWLEALTDGKVTTFRKFVLEMGFPSFELFINSAFAAQGRGDEFARTKPSARKDLFAQFLGLSELIRRAKTSGESAELCQRAGERLAIKAGILSAETDGTVVAEIDRRAISLGIAEQQATTLRAQLLETIAGVEARLATMQDAVAAHGAATLRIQTLQAEMQSRARENRVVDEEGRTADLTWQRELNRLSLLRDTTIRRLDHELADLASNPQLAKQLAEIDEMLQNNLALQADDVVVRGAAAKVQAADQEMARLRVTLDEQIAESSTCATQLRDAEQALAALQPIAQQHDLSARDAAILGNVPCGGAAPYDACQFLQNATAGKAKLEELVKQLEPKADLAERVGRLLREKESLTAAITLTRTAIAEQQSTKKAHAEKAGLLERLNAAADRIGELNKTRAAAVSAAADATDRARQNVEATRARAIAEHDGAAAALREREQQALVERQTRLVAIQDRITALERDLVCANADLEAVAAGNSAAGQLQTELDRARHSSEIALQEQTRATSGLQQVERDRAVLSEKQAQLADVQRRLDVINRTGVLEWRGLAKDLGKGGLADLEIDAAGPTIAATCNLLLTAADLAKFSLQIITQSEKVDGGMKDDFDVLVMDNTDGRGWRPLRTFSGGQRTVIQEALMLAIALYVNERSALPMRTLWRDETGAALDRDNARRYVEMLRKAREIGGFHQVFFISHTDDCKEMADAQIVVGNGTAVIALPPFAPVFAPAGASLLEFA